MLQNLLKFSDAPETLDATDGIAAAGKTVSAGENCDVTRIFRHFLGLATITNAVTKADLGKLKDWAGTKAGGAWAVEDNV